MILELCCSCLGFDRGANVKAIRYPSEGETSSNVHIFKKTFYNFETPHIL